MKWAIGAFGVTAVMGTVWLHQQSRKIAVLRYDVHELRGNVRDVQTAAEMRWRATRLLVGLDAVTPNSRPNLRVIAGGAS